MKVKNIWIVGTSHIAKESVKEIRQTIEKVKPDIVAVELDAKRFAALLAPEKDRRTPSLSRIGLQGFLFSVIGRYAQRKLGDMVKMEPGAEMIEAITIAREKKADIALIDRDIEVTLSRLRLGWREKGHMVWDVIKGFVFRQEVVTFDLNTVPSKETVKRLMLQVKQRYPKLYRVLVEERDRHMAQKLAALSKERHDKRIVAVVGAGHEDGILRRLEASLEHKH